MVAVAQQAGSDAGVYAVAGAGVCLAPRLIGMRYDVTVPIARNGGQLDGEDDRAS